MPDPERIPTGTGPERRRLSVAEAERGCVPDPFSAEEWAALYQASQDGAAAWAERERERRQGATETAVDVSHLPVGRYRMTDTGTQIVETAWGPAIVGTPKFIIVPEP
jgi:hypothetical protein